MAFQNCLKICLLLVFLLNATPRKVKGCVYEATKCRNCHNNDDETWHKLLLTWLHKKDASKYKLHKKDANIF